MTAAAGANGVRAAHGDLNAWNTLLNLCKSNLVDTANYMRLLGRNADGTRNLALPVYLDAENYIDYMLLHFYIAMADWPINNYWFSRERTNTSTGFKFHPWDADFSLLDGSKNNTGVIGDVATPYAACRQNVEFRTLFGDRVQKHLFNGGALSVDPAAPQWDPAHPERNVPAARFAALGDVIARALVGESARWGDVRRGTPFTRDNDWTLAKTNVLNNFFSPRHGFL